MREYESNKCYNMTSTASEKPAKNAERKKPARIGRAFALWRLCRWDTYLNIYQKTDRYKIEALLNRGAYKTGNCGRNCTYAYSTIYASRNQTRSLAVFDGDTWITEDRYNPDRAFGKDIAKTFAAKGALLKIGRDLMVWNT